MKNKFLLLLIVSSSIFLNSCSGVESFFFPPSEERKLGEAFDRELRDSTLVFYSTTSTNEDEKWLANYLDSLGKSLVGNIPASDWNHLLPSGEGLNEQNFFSFVIIQEDVVNAFAVPGGFTYFYTGILKTMKTEAELVGVLGHEVGHVIEHHSREKMIRAGVASTVLSLLLGGEEDNALAEITASLGAAWWVNSNSPDKELESDEHGVRFAYDMGIDPRGIEYFFGRGLIDETTGECVPKEQSFLEGILGALASTHPPHCDRVNQSRSIVGTLSGVKTVSDADEEWFQTNVIDRVNRITNGQ